MANLKACPLRAKHLEYASMNPTTALRTLCRGVSIVAVAATLPSSPSAQSFDCSKARTSVEKMICADRELSTLDEELARAFGDARKQVDAAVIGQVTWLREVRNRCATVACLKETYRSRIVFLRKVRPPRAAFSLEGVVGEWSRVGSTPKESTRLTIDAVSAEGFSFAIFASLQLSDPDNFRLGEIEGQAAIRADTAVYRHEDTKCEVTFSRKGARLVVATSAECVEMGGMAVTFDGDFQK